MFIWLNPPTFPVGITLPPPPPPLPPPPPQPPPMLCPAWPLIIVELHPVGMLLELGCCCKPHVPLGAGLLRAELQPVPAEEVGAD